MSSQHVGLFIDFENLIYGLVDKYGEQGAFELFKVHFLSDFAARYGVVCSAYAYADWRIKAVNQWQVDLYGRGVELVHVLGRGGKNAVDIRMAIDLVESIYTQPLLDTYIVVSGDRDFLPVINALKRAGKRVIALSTSRAMSKEMKRVCDETSSYESLLHDLSHSVTTAKRDPEVLLDEVLSIAKSFNGDELTGAQLKQLLLQSHKGQFVERDYGFVSFGALMEQLSKLSRERISDDEGQFPPILSLIRPPQGDLRVMIVADADQETALPPSAQEWQGAHEVQLAIACLKGYQYMPDAKRRREVLEALYTVLSPTQGACWAEALDEVCQTVGLSRSQASKYHAVLLQSQAFIQVDPHDDKPVKQRTMKLIEGLRSAESLIHRYEQSILHKIISRRGPVSDEVAAQVLGIDCDQNQTYLQGLINAASNEASEHVDQ